ncbi:hypothetical protein QZH41_009659 [Actinostola sp. cb2023]|nr:hypothetical protein QZH41_009659 [Actinostola sp. cb2023]
MKTFQACKSSRAFILLLIVVLADFAQPCILLLNGWSKMSAGERAKLVKVVFVGKVVGLYPVDPQSQTYAAEFEIFRILKGEHIVNEVLELHPGPTVKVYGFGEKRLCYSEVYTEEIHLVFMVFEPKSRLLVARYDDIFGATSPVTAENENEILAALGWKPWSSWSTCTRSCDGGLQWRTRQCAQDKCDGRKREGRKCNFFNCYGIKNVGQYFSPQPSRGLPTRTRTARHVTLQGITALSLPTAKVFQYYFPDEYSITITFRPVQYSDIYLLALYDSANNLQFGIRLTSGFLTFELTKTTKYMRRQFSLDFNVDIALNKWHSVTFSLQAKQMTMYWDCQKVGTKPLPGRFSFAPDPSGTIHLGKPFLSFDQGQKNIEIDELYFVPDVEAAKQQCVSTTFSSMVSQRNNIDASGSAPIERQEGSGLSNYVDDKDQVETAWSQWSPCSTTCGNGVRRRVMMCVNLDDGPPDDECLQVLQTAEEKPCKLRDCPGQSSKSVAYSAKFTGNNTIYGSLRLGHCSKPCLNGGYCNSDSRCQCKAGYHGNACEKVSCNVKCLNGGRCVGPEFCQCAAGYTGKQCEKPICSSPCQNGGTCVRPNVCRCQAGYQQPNCRAACYPACINGGSCVGPNTCRCPRGFTGKLCQKAFCSQPCLNGGICYAPNQCSCSYGWYGPRCAKARCLRKCRNGGNCVRPNMCLCPRGMYGYYCQYGTLRMIEYNEEGTEGRRDGGKKGRREEGTEGRRDGGKKGRREEGTEGRRDGGKKGRREEGKKGRREEGKKGRREEGKKGRREEGKKGRREEGNVKEYVHISYMWPYFLCLFQDSNIST